MENRRRKTDLEIEYLLLSVINAVPNPTLHTICEATDLHPKTVKEKIKEFKARSIVEEISIDDTCFYKIIMDKENFERYLKFLIEEIGRERIEELKKTYF